MAAVDLRMSLLTPKTLDVHNGQAEDLHLAERFLDRFKLGRLNDCQAHFLDSHSERVQFRLRFRARAHASFAIQTAVLPASARYKPGAAPVIGQVALLDLAECLAVPPDAFSPVAVHLAAAD